MNTASSKERRFFDLAFKLAFCIHVNKEVAFFVAEDALDGLALTLGKQEKNRRPAEQLRGFLKWGERNRPIRKTVRLNEPQMLQWLVYKESEIWERQTERGEGLYLPTGEDLIVRYIKHLVYNTVRRDAFYVTLAVGPLLHQFDRRETRVFYDILTQSDSARMKDMNYIGKQRLEMLEMVARRFEPMIQMITIPGDEKHLVMQPTTPELVELVNELRRRFTPWETTCVIEPGFDITDIPGLYFSETSSDDEDLIAMNRIHTVLEPECFGRFTHGLSKYVQTLPSGDQDKSCNYDSLEERLKIPKFANSPEGSSRGDRFQAPPLAEEDYIRLSRLLEARSHRRKTFTPNKLLVYVDDLLAGSFDPAKTSQARRLIALDAGVIVVKGQDSVGEVTLAILPLTDDQFPGKAFRDSISHSGCMITIDLAPVHDSDGALTGLQLEVSYEQLGWRSRLIQRWLGLLSSQKAGHSWLIPAAVVAVLIILAGTLIWWRVVLRPAARKGGSPELTIQPQRREKVEENRAVALSTPSPPPKTSPSREADSMVASASWSTKREEAVGAIPIESTRGEKLVLDLSAAQTKIALNLPVFDEQGRQYYSYRLTLVGSETRLWQQTRQAPRTSLTGYSHSLDLLLTRRLPGPGPYDLQVEGNNKSGWLRIGHVMFSSRE